MERRGIKTFIFTQLWISWFHSLLTFTQILLPLKSFNDFLLVMVVFDACSMLVLMVVHHWSNDGMVTYHRWNLVWTYLHISAKFCQIKKWLIFARLSCCAANFLNAATSPPGCGNTRIHVGFNMIYMLNNTLTCLIFNSLLGFRVPKMCVQETS